MKARGCLGQPARTTAASGQPLPLRTSATKTLLPDSHLRKMPFAAAPAKARGKIHPGGGCRPMGTPPCALPDLFLGRFSGKNKARATMLAAWMYFWLPDPPPPGDLCSPKLRAADAGRMKADSSSSLRLPPQPSARSGCRFRYRAHSLAREEVAILFLLLFFLCDIFLLPTKWRAPSGQAIRLEDQQYMKQERDQFAEKRLKVVYYIFYLFFFFGWEITHRIIKRKTKWTGQPATKNCLFFPPAI